MTDTLYPTHLAHRGEGTLPVPISMIVCPACENVFGVVALWPQNAPSVCCYCSHPLVFKDGTAGYSVNLTADSIKPPQSKKGGA